MENIKIFFIKHSKILLTGALLNLVVLAVVVILAGGYVYLNRGEIFDSFMSRYIDRINAQEQEGGGGLARNLLVEESTIIDVVEKANPAVVSIVVTKDVPVLEQYFENFSPFDDFFGFDSFKFRVPQYREKGTEKKEVGGGSGFFVSSDGLVITNKHVVADDDASYMVLTNDGEKYKAKVLARDPFLDIAVLEIEAKNLPYLPFGDSNVLKQGQTVIAIGNALGEFRNSVSVGVISGLSRSVVAVDGLGGSELLEEVIQTDAAINPGNSGGPLISLSGAVIGVNVAVARGSENIGFALPANIVKGVVSSVKEFGEIIRPYVGIRYMQITELLKEKNNLSVDYGALIARGETSEELAVIPGSPADKAGIMENDIILEIDGVKIDGKKSLGLMIRQKKVGDKITFKVLSKGKEKIIIITLEKYPEGL